jgi:hypothetical protein
LNSVSCGSINISVEVLQNKGKGSESRSRCMLAATYFPEYVEECPSYAWVADESPVIVKKGAPDAGELELMAGLQG